MYPLDKLFLQKKYADNTYRRFVSGYYISHTHLTFSPYWKHIHPTLNSYMGQIVRVWWVLIYPLWSHVAVSYNLRTMYVYHRNRLYVTDVA
jgi:hypothetical protein